MKGDVIGKREFDRDEMYRVEDIDTVPNGYATVLRIYTLDRRRITTGKIDGDGFVRTLDGEYVPIEGYEVESR